MDASSYGLTDIIQLLLSAGANVNQKTKKVLVFFLFVMLNTLTYLLLIFFFFKETRGFFSFFSSFTEVCIFCCSFFSRLGVD